MSNHIQKSLNIEDFDLMPGADAERLNLSKFKGNDYILAKPQGQLFNAKGHFGNGIKHAGNAAIDLVCAGGHAAGVALQVHGTIVAVQNVGNIVQEVAIGLNAAVIVENGSEKIGNGIKHLFGKPALPREVTKLDQAAKIVVKADEVLHNNTGFIAAGFEAVKSWFNPTHVIGLFSRSYNAVKHTYKAVEEEVYAGISLVKAGCLLVKQTYDNFNTVSKDSNEPQKAVKEIKFSVDHNDDVANDHISLGMSDLGDSFEMNVIGDQG